MQLHLDQDVGQLAEDKVLLFPLQQICLQKYGTECDSVWK